jgi:hypothetical protein
LRREQRQKTEANPFGPNHATVAHSRRPSLLLSKRLSSRFFGLDVGLRLLFSSFAY